MLRPLPEVLVLDSQTLVAAAWPKPKAELVEVLKYAKAAGVEVWVPQGVLMECCGKALREFEAASERLRTAARELSRFGRVPESADAIKGAAEVEREWHAQNAAVAAELGVKTIGFSARPVEEYFAAAVARRSPFKEKGEGFRDAVIAASAVDELRARRRTRAWLISQNEKDFRDLTAWNTGDMAIECVPLEVVAERCRQHAARSDHDRLGAMEQAAREVVEGQRPALLKYCQDNLKIAVNDLPSDGVPLRFDVADVAEVRAVHLADYADVAAGADVAVTAVVRLRLEVVFVPVRGEALPPMMAGREYEEALQQHYLVELMSRGNDAVTGFRGASKYSRMAWVKIDGRIQRTETGYQNPRFDGVEFLNGVSRIVLGLDE
jgi:hypothetical protein